MQVIINLKVLSIHYVDRYERIKNVFTTNEQQRWNLVMLWIHPNKLSMLHKKHQWKCPWRQLSSVDDDKNIERIIIIQRKPFHPFDVRIKRTIIACVREWISFSDSTQVSVCNLSSIEHMCKSKQRPIHSTWYSFSHAVWKVGGKTAVDAPVCVCARA